MWIDPLGFAGNNILHESEFWNVIKDSVKKTKLDVKGARVYEVIKKVDIPGIKKGDFFHLDTLHKNEFEVYDSQKKHKAVYDLNGKKIGEGIKGRRCG